MAKCQDGVPGALLGGIKRAKRLFMGMRASYAWSDDPKHILFQLARAKFVSKMLVGYPKVLEVGCGDAFASTLVAQTVRRLVCSDREVYTLEHCAESPVLRDKATFLQHDMVTGPTREKFDAVYSMDVIEHIPPRSEGRFLRNIARSLRGHGVAIIGTPNVTAARYQSKGSRLEHVNLKDPIGLGRAMGRHFRSVFLFGMNDETLHTGFAAMRHYLLALCVGRR